MASKKTFEDLDLSHEEIKRIETALKDEKFRKMFVEYAEEISNPENRKRYEEEIAMLEKERGMNVEFINPTPGHVLKTTGDDGKKTFINICQNDKIAKPTSKRELTPGLRGMHWQIPHSFSPPREDFDKSKQTCMVYDVVFHPDTYRMTSNKAFLKLVEDTALDGIEKQFGVKLDRNNIRRPNMKSKGSLPATVIRNRTNDSNKTTTNENDPMSSMPYPYGDKTSAELAEENLKNASKKAKAEETKKNKTKSNMVKKEESGFTTPRFNILHRTDMDLQNFTNAPDSRPTTRPKELVVTIELPLCKSAAGVDLDIFEEKLFLKSEKPAYKLELKLPYPVDDENGSAKFDKSKKALVVTLPVVAGEVPKMPSFIDDLKTPEQTQNDAPPLIEELPPLEDISEVKDPVPEDLPPLEEIETTEAVKETETTKAPVKKSPEVSYTFPEYTFSQDSETVTFVFLVRNISDQSVTKSFATPGECHVKFLSKGSGGFPMHYSFYCRFDDNCNVVPEHCTTDIIGRNMTLTLLKQKECRGLWNKFMAGVDSSSAEEKIFVTTDNLQAELDQLQAEGEAMGRTDEHTTDEHPHDIKVTEMNEKKLSLNIRKPTTSFSEEEEDSYVDDIPLSAGIEVVHSRGTPPNLHGILKQRSMSESSEDPSSGESPTSLSPRDSDGTKRCVTFNSKVDKTTFKTNAAVTSMKQALKSKRKRNRIREEKKRSRENRKRHNSNGSECSSCDEHDGRHSSESHSEDDVDTGEDLAQQLEATGKKIEDCGVIEEAQEDADDKGEQDVKSEEKNVEESDENKEKKQDGNDESKKPGYQIQSEKSAESESKSSKLAMQVKNKMAEKKSDEAAADSDDDCDNDENGERTNDKSGEKGYVTKVENQEKAVNKTSLENGNGEKSESGSDENDLKGVNGDTKAAGKDSGDIIDTNGDKTSAIKGDNPGKTKSGKGSKNKKKKGVKFTEDSKTSDQNKGDGDKSDKSDPREVIPMKSDVETELRWNETNHKNDPNNEHRTQCAFDFSNNVMFDLDID